VISIRFNPARVSASIKRSFKTVPTEEGSFCNPSRGPTS
jgi:hypothetical protein